MNERAQELLGHALTVSGPVAADNLGMTLVHEHLLIKHQGPLVNLTDPVASRQEMQRALRHGVRTVVDMTNVGLERDADGVAEIAELSGMQIILGTGFYKDGWLPSWVHGMDTDEMARMMVQDILVGSGANHVRCGVIGEVGVSRRISPTEERSLAASARAQRETGVAINVHFDIGTERAEYHHAIDILEGEGADLGRVVLDHFVCRPDELGLARELTGRGPYVEFDLFGQEVWPKILDLTGHTPPEVQVASLRWFVAAGLADRVLISHDLGNRVQQRVNGGFGQAHIPKTLIPGFRKHGISNQDLDAILVENPRRLLPIQAVPS